LYDQPIAYSNYKELNVKILQAYIDCMNNRNLEPGTIIDINKHGIFVSTNDGVIRITKIQLPSKKPINVKEMINGHHPFQINTKFNDE